MLPFFAGGNPFAASPEQAIAAQAQQPDPQDPQTTGAIPAPMQAPAPAATGPSIGDRVANAFSGRGFFGSSDPRDEVPDPNTGISPADRRAASAQSMMKMGLLFLAAGQRQTSDQRAAILAKAPDLVGGSSDLNSFAKSRLEMAKLKMEQRKQDMEEETGRQQIQALKELSGGGAPAPSVGQQAVAQAQSRLQTAGAATGLTPGADAGGGAPAPAQVAPAPMNALSAPGGVPRGALLSRADALGVMAQNGIGARGVALNQAVQNAQSRQITGNVQYDQRTGEYRAPKYNGRGEITGYDTIGKPEDQVEDVTDKDGNQYRETYHINPVTGARVVKARSDIAESPATGEDRRMQAGILRDNYKDLNSQYQDQIQGSMQRYDKLAKVRDDVMNGKGIFGTGAPTRAAIVKGLSTAGLISPKYADDLVANDNFMRASKDSVADVIKNFNGSQGVSNADRDFAAQVVGASVNGTREQIVNSLTNNMADISNKARNYDTNAEQHNENAKMLPEGSQKLLRARTVGRDFDSEERAFSDRLAAWKQGRQDAFDESGTAAPARTAPAVTPKYTPAEIAAEMERRRKLQGR